MLHLFLPFPPRELNPNRNPGWRIKGPIYEQYKDDCKLAAQQFKPKFEPGKIILHILYTPPNIRTDWDNMIAASKAAFDGMAEAWGVNDVRFRPGGIDYADKPDKKFPRIEVFIKNVQY